jgi:phosphoribosylglycinamide formyltransferase-1
MNNITILASGSGTNAENIIRFFQKNESAQVNLLLANRENAYALTRAKNLNVPAIVFNRDDLYKTGRVMNILNDYSTDIIILAGFLWLIPGDIIKAYPNRILNIHPALLPSYGGKGMYGSRVHEAVIANKEKESGMTIHIVNEEYDRGDIIFQAVCPVMEDDTPDSLASRIHELEYEHYPKVILEYLGKL